MLLMSSASAAPWPAAFEPASSALLSGVIGSLGCCSDKLPGAFALWSPDAFPVVLGAQNSLPVVVAAAPSAGPRVVGFAHEGLVSDSLAAPADTTPSARSNIDKLVLNALRWLAWDRTRVRIAYLTNPDHAPRWTAAVSRLQTALNASSPGPALSSNWTSVNITSFLATNIQYDMLIVDAYQYTMNAGQAAAITNWLRAGPKRSLLVVGHAWYWGQSNANANLFTALSVNQLLWPYGIVLTRNSQASLQDASVEARMTYPYFGGQTAVLNLIEQLQGSANLVELTYEEKAAVYQGVVQFLNILPRRTDLASAAMLSQIYAYLDIAQLSYSAWSSWAAPGAAAPNWAALTLTGNQGDKLAASLSIFNTHRATLLRGIPGRPVTGAVNHATYRIWAPFAWPIALADESEPVAVASTPLTGGRVVALGSEVPVYNYLVARDADAVDALVINSFRWLGYNLTARTIRICSEDASRMAQIVLGLRAQAAAGVNITATTISLDSLNAANCEILFIDLNVNLTPNRINLIKNFLRASNKGLMVAGFTWYPWYKGPSTNPLTSAPHNKLLYDMGFWGLPFYRWGPMAVPAATSLNDPTVWWIQQNAWYLTMQLLREKYGGPAFYGYSTTIARLKLFIQQLPARTDPAFAAMGLGPMFASVFTARRKNRNLTLAGDAVMDLTTAHPGDWLDVYLDSWVCRTADMGDPTWLSRFAASYPGVVGANSLPRTIAVSIDGGNLYKLNNTKFRGDTLDTWRSTGAWFSPTPGKSTVLTVSPNAVNKGLMVQIGSHTDDFSDRSYWSRVPLIYNRFPITSISTTIANPMGGLIYIVLPVNTSVGPIDVTLTNVHRAPRYVHGKTNLAQWNSVRNLPVPWTEFESPTNIILQVPSKNAKTVDDPVALMTHWDKVIDSMTWLSGNIRFRAERFSLDIDTLYGWMYASYPIQTYGAWGPFHEIGHMHQWWPMEFRGTSEASVNLFTLYALEATGVKVENVPDRLDRSFLFPIRSCYFRNTPNPADLAKRTPPNWMNEWGTWVGLDTYLQLKEGFGGWDFIRRVFAYYISSNVIPADDAASVQLFIRTTSRLANRNLVPFFEIWGFPIDAATRTFAAAYPAWTTNPMLTWKPSAVDPVGCIGSMGRRRV
ncbi:hypothetical protein HYH03_012453 [Edaphochlamys debaryana]|uniref:Peptidase M60 domain-containing protein n=1 Tax=Edaphochlamys debaryana TaxID=47281 RepID=A0A835XSS3_9CHLO|nr:hypothetical protein HYH03_012453 [Edaphochlamys debaryana]|eukprot:KAG2489015.1 hypothetical protein HYH03_012453 [Edaphochlamys debaryana]